MRNHTCRLDHHQRSHDDTITIGPEGKFNWVLQLINSQMVRLFDSLEEKFNTKRSPNQPNQSQNQSVIDRRNLIAQKMCLLLKVKRPVPTRSMKKGFHEKLCVSDGSGQPEITLSVIEARDLSENTRVEQTHDGSLQPDECNSSRAHTVKEQHAPDEHREIG